MDILKLTGTSWLIHDGDHGIIVDAGLKGRMDAFKRKLESLDLSIPLIFLTHTHYDHTGCAQKLQEYTGAKVIVGEAEKQCLMQGYTPVPKGTHAFGRFVSNTGHKLMQKQSEFYQPVTKDIISVNSICDLSEYGFDARVLPLGAHSKGSIGLLIDDYFFAGDTVFGIRGFVYPPFADCPDEFRTAWETILETGARFICPGHGGVVSREKLDEQYHARYGNR